MVDYYEVTERQRQENVAVMQRALDILVQDRRVEDFELEMLSLVFAGAHGAPMPEGDWVYVRGNRRGFRRHYLIRTATEDLWPLPIDEHYDREDVARLAMERQARDRPETK